MDWRHLLELLTAAEGIYELKNLCAWVKDNAGGCRFALDPEL
jgi:hypothetical protein